jgi:predicted amidohydrolase
MTFRAGCCQFEPVFGDRSRNLRQALSLLEEADADLMVLPELPFTGYSFESREELASMAEDPESSEITAGIGGLCLRRGMHVVTGFAEKRGDRLYNSSLLIGPGGLVSIYRKMHLFWREFDYFDRGDTPFTVTDAGGLRVGMMICFDWVYPEAARILALRGADVLAHPSNLVLSHCQDAMVTRCLENSVYAVTANRTGTEARAGTVTTFTGRSRITAPDGEVLCTGGVDTEEVLVSDIDTELARSGTMTPRNRLLADRRPEFYGDLTSAGLPGKEERPDQ